MRANAQHRAGRTGFLLMAALASAVALAAAACGSAPSSPQAGAGSGSSHSPMHSRSPMHHNSPMPSHSAMTESRPFGTDCSMLPESGMGSLHGMSMEPVATAAAHNPLLTTFAADVKSAGLTSDLNGMHALTVFAPSDSAFVKLSHHDMMMMHSQVELARILKYHVVSGHVTPAELAHGMTLRTLEGGSLKTAKMGSVYEVNGAAIVCGNITTANATVYIIGKVLRPMG
jgi:uncharacterized surface protein with fasciclin (FAS1) repeats